MQTPLRRLAAAALVAIAPLAAGVAHAGNINWSIGIHAPIAPGVTVGTVISDGPRHGGYGAYGAYGSYGHPSGYGGDGYPVPAVVYGPPVYGPPVYVGAPPVWVTPRAQPRYRYVPDRDRDGIPDRYDRRDNRYDHRHDRRHDGRRDRWYDSRHDGWYGDRGPSRHPDHVVPIMR